MLIETVSLVIGLIAFGQMEPLPHLGSLTDGLRGPARIAIASDNTLLVTDPLNGYIARFDASGELIATWPVPLGPIGVAVHPDGRIFVSLRDEPKVAVYDETFTFLEYLGENEPGIAFAGPTDIEIAPDSGRIYVVDSDADQVYGFNSDCTLALTVGSRGGWAGEFLFPSAIAVDESRNRLIIADHDNFRIQVFTMGGVFLFQFGDRLHSIGTQMEGWMPRAQGLTVDSHGRIYVTDALMGTIRVFDEGGTELGKVAGYGYEPGDLRVPCGLTTSADGSRLYVVSTNSSAVEVYDLTDMTHAATGSQVAEADLVQPEEHDLTVLDKAREAAWNGPHIVEDRPDLCTPCHGITGQPGSHGGTVEGQAVLCMSCHSSGGRAMHVPIHERDMADPFGTNDSAADGRGRSHAWGVSAINTQADSTGPVPGSAMASYLDGDGNIKCSTCHNQHNTDYGTSYLRVNNSADAMCKECHAPRNRDVGEGGSHPVGTVYPADEDEYPSAGELTPLVLKDAKIECMTCHAPHGADSGGANGGDGDGMLLHMVNDESLCQICHTEHTIHNVAGDWQPTCNECHDIHDAENENVALISRQVDGSAVSFVAPEFACSEKGDFIHAVCEVPSYDGICETCHTDTDYHRNNPELDHAHSTHAKCTDCHLHSLGFLASCIGCHGEPPDGAATPNRAGAHEIHLTGVSGPKIEECDTCHTPSDEATHDNGLLGFVSGVDADLDGNIDLSETDVCDTCHSPDGPFNGVGDPVIGAKANWYDGVYDGNVLKAAKADWCLGCHDEPGAEVDGVTAPLIAGDNRTWGYYIGGHGESEVLCTDCHDPTLSHTDGVEMTFSLRFPLSFYGSPERVFDQEAYNAGYRLRLIDGQQALAVPREPGDYTPDDFRLCLSCHDEMKLLGVPINYGWQFTGPPPELLLPEGVAQTNYRNDLEWGYAYYNNGGRPANPHWNHLGWAGPNWSLDEDDLVFDSRLQCVTCHNPHGVQAADGGPTPARTKADLAITHDVYNDGTTDYQYGYIGSEAYLVAGGDLHCWPCHPWAGPGPDPPGPLPEEQTRYYREPLELPKRTCVMCHKVGSDEKLRAKGAAPITTAEPPQDRTTACSTANDGFTDADCLVCHDMSRHRLGQTLLTVPKPGSKRTTRVGLRGLR